MLLRQMKQKILAPLLQQPTVARESNWWLEVEKAKERFGADLIVIPNAIYGDWESAVGDISKLSLEEKRAARLKALVPFQP